MSALKPVDEATTCTYRFVDHEGHVETCRAKAACPVCGQCSRISGEHENGHCPGHNGLLPHIRVPGQENDKVRKEIARNHVRRGK